MIQRLPHSSVFSEPELSSPMENKPIPSLLERMRSTMLRVILRPKKPYIPREMDRRAREFFSRLEEDHRDTSMQ